MGYPLNVLRKFIHMQGRNHWRKGYLGMSVNVVELRRKTAPDDETTVRKAFRDLRGLFMRGTGIEPTERQIIEAAIRLCVKVDRAAAGEQPRQFGNSMPQYSRRLDERIDDAKQRQIDHDAGDLPEPINVNAAEIKAAEAIERVFRECMTAKDKVRDWKLLFMLASKSGDGLGVQAEYPGSIRHIARKFSIDPKRVRAIRDRQMTVIAARTRYVVPEPEYRTGIVLQAA
jgi:hypothetical protein